VAIGYLGNERSPGLVASGLALTLLLGGLSHRWVEQPARFALRGVGRWQTAAVGAGLVVLVTGPAVLVHRAQGAPGRLPEAVEIAAREANNGNPRRAECHLIKGGQSPSCRYGEGPLGALLVGDSHADALAPALAGAAASTGAAIMEWTYSACPTIQGAERPYPHTFGPTFSCARFNQWVLDAVARREDSVPVVIINRTSAFAIGPTEPSEPARPLVRFIDAEPTPGDAFRAEFARRLVDTACTLAVHRPVYLMRPVPEMPVEVPKVLSRRLAMGWMGEVSITRASYQARHALVWAAQDEAAKRCGARILDPLPYLCDNERCYGSRHGRPLYYDDDHLSMTGAALLSPMFAPVFAARGLGAP